jgi:hypothetical protein
MSRRRVIFSFRTKVAIDGGEHHARLAQHRHQRHRRDRHRPQRDAVGAHGAGPPTNAFFQLDLK